MNPPFVRVVSVAAIVLSAAMMKNPAKGETLLPIKTTMETAELGAFVRVAQAGSFTRAAEILGTQKSHLSRLVAGLERKLGVRLLERSTRAMHLTEVGREVFERGVGVLAALDDTVRLAQQTNAEPRGTLRLTCGVEFGLIAVSGWIDRYLARFPAVRVDAEYTGRLIDLVHEGFDLAIRVGELGDSRLVARRLGTLRYGLYASPAYLRRHGRPKDPADLAAHALLAFTGGRHRGAWRLRRGPDEASVNVAARLNVNNGFAVRDAAVAGLGIALLARPVARDAVQAKSLVPVLARWEGHEIPVHAVFASNRYLSPKVRAFVDLALAEFPALD